MIHIPYRTKLAVAVAFGVFTLAASPVAVLAAHGANNPNGTTTETEHTTTTTEDSSHHSTTETVHHSSDSSTTTTGDDGGNDLLLVRGKQLLDEKRKTGKEHTTAERQQACTTHEDAINTRFTTLGSKAEQYLTSFNATFTKVQAYQSRNQLAVANYDALVADATAKQTAATTAVATLKSLAGTKIDCTLTDPATSVADVKTAATDARTALQAYRTSLKALVHALLDAKKAASPDTNTTGSN